MKILWESLGFLATVIPLAASQASYGQIYTDPATGISFGTSHINDGTTSSLTKGGFTFGMALPTSATTADYPDYIGIITGSINSGKGWSSISHNGNMINGLLLTAWAYGGEIYTSFRYATAWNEPTIYRGSAKLTPISKTISTNSFTLIYLCQNCLTGNATIGLNPALGTSNGVTIVGWAQALFNPTNPTDPNSAVVNQHDNGYGTYGQIVSNCTFASYSSWATKTMAVSTSPPTATPTTPPTVPTLSSRPVPTGATFDYIVVGGGAGGLPFADKISAAGKKTLLIERGPPSTGRWGGTMKPDWLVGTNLTRFDVPGLCNQIWSSTAPNSGGIKCTDIGMMAGCVLGGGTAINAGLWWKPYALDWDYNFPSGWKSADVSAATTRVFSRIPGTDVPSMDGQLYLQQGFNVLASGLKSAGWTSVVANNVPAQKNRTYAHTPYMSANGERGGPLATYLVTASARSNFNLWVNTTVKRVIRTGGHITGVEVEPYANGGYKGVVNVTATTGRVVLSAGAFGTPKILFRSGIGPADQLAIVNTSASDAGKMISSNQWINLPVGYNLDDHCNTDTVISHPNVTFYDFYGAWSAPVAADKTLYLNKRSGILAQAAPNIGPMFWDQITGSDGITRQLQWTSRVEGSLGAADGKSMTMSQYLGRGSTGRGRATIDASLNMVVSKVPYLQSQGDIDAVVQGIKNLQAALSTVKDLTWNSPAPGVSAATYVANYKVDTSRSANHWMGTAKLGNDDGRLSTTNTAVVDLNAKVYGTDNLFVVDASIFPGMVSTNPSSLIVVAAEKASDLILALPAPTPQARYSSCGGQTYSGSSICVAPYTCTVVTAFYSQCL